MNLNSKLESLSNETQETKEPEILLKTETRMVMGAWVSCLCSLPISNCCGVALYSFFSTTLPNQQNLITSFDTVLVLALTSAVNIMVRIFLR